MQGSRAPCVKAHVSARCAAVHEERPVTSTFLSVCDGEERIKMEKHKKELLSLSARQMETRCNMMWLINDTFLYKLGLGNVRTLIFWLDLKVCVRLSVLLICTWGVICGGICWQTLNVVFVINIYFSYLFCVFLFLTQVETVSYWFLSTFVR